MTKKFINIKDVQIDKLLKALHYYADHHEVPNEGPWGVDSDDWGRVARIAILEYQDGKLT